MDMAGPPLARRTVLGATASRPNRPYDRQRRRSYRSQWDGACGIEADGAVPPPRRLCRVACAVDAGKPEQILRHVLDGIPRRV